ncbi:PREDICTED: E3 ubiquitin-protein ligase TRAIP, partial [Thamnophis sirtalis]|uniref:E3 ubiquitin-protein ligase TRAIP n=1 Tax=Thamnophis sirtalis TaxID=35019 RepID=A0A6I9X227_9SAUR
MKEKEKRDCQSIVNALRETLDLRNATVESLQKAISDTEMLCSTLKKQMKYLEQEQEETKSAKEETQKLRRKVKSMERIETLLHSQRSEVEKMIREMGTGQAAMEQLAVYCISLKKEYENLKESQKASNDTVEKLRKELFSANHKLQKTALELEKTTEELKNTQTDLRTADKEITSLKKKIGVLQDTIKVPSLTSEALSRLVSESPAPAQFLNPKFHQPAHNDEIDLNATFDVDTPKAHKTAVAPAKKIKLDKNPAAVTNLSRVLKGTMEQNCSTDTDDEHLEDLLPSFIKKSVLTKKTVLNSIPQKNTGIVRIGYDGFGGRTKFIQPTFPTEIRPLIIKSKKRTVSK